VVTAALMMAAGPARGLEIIWLKSGDTWHCLRHEPAGSHVRVYTSEGSYIEIPAGEIVNVEVVPEPVVVEPAVAASPEVRSAPAPSARPLTRAEMDEMLAAAGREHNIDVDLLASVVKAESNFEPRAVSRAGAQGLMQLMPATAAQMSVTDSFEAQQNIQGGTAYLDQLLVRYHDDLALAVAAYNAGPAAVDRYHGVPPYRETRAYVARVIREFNRRKGLTARR
jgi:hypothetical protein